MLNLNCLEYVIDAVTAKIYLANRMNELEHLLEKGDFRS